MSQHPELTVKLLNGYTLCASVAEDDAEQPGIIIYLKDAAGSVSQDIAGIHVTPDNQIRHLLYEDSMDENYTRESMIPVYNENQ